MIWKGLAKEHKIGEVNFIKKQERNAVNKEPRIVMKVPMRATMGLMKILPTRRIEKAKAVFII